MKNAILCAAAALLLACSGNNTAGNNAADMGADTSSDNNGLIYNNSDQCCPSEGVSAGDSCRLECGPCEFQYDTEQPGCGSYTVSCDGTTWVELEERRVFPTEACEMPGDMGQDTGSSTPDMTAEDMAADMAEPEDMFMFPDVMAQDCFHPSSDPNCPMGEFGAGTFLRTLEVDESQDCCRDFTGDGVNDNQIGLYARILAATGEDINANLQATIDQGSLAYLFSYSGWSNEMFDDDLQLTVLLGADEDIDFADNLAGNGRFLVKPESFDAMTGDPKWVFDDVEVINGRLVARGGTLQLFFPNLLDEVQLLATDVRIEADVVPPTDLASGGTVALANGELSGALERDLFYESMNEAAAACTCIGMPVFEYRSDQDDYQCLTTEEIELACQFDPSSGCRFLSNQQACFFFQQASSGVDVDTDADGAADAFSVGVKFTGVGASIAGRQ